MHPKILDLGPITIHTYGLLLALAFICGIWVTSRNARKQGIEPDLVWNLGLVIIFSALVGAKLILFLSDYRYYSGNPREIFALSTLRSSGAYYGGLFLALASTIWFIKKKGFPFWTIADLAAPGIALGQAISQLGCLSAGCCYGKPTHVPWAIAFTDRYAYENVGVPLNIPLHPTQIYESIGALCLFLFLMQRFSKKHAAGQILLEYIALYALIRFVVEFFRDDDRGFVLYGLLSTSQFIAVLAILGSAAAYYFLVRRPTEAPQN
jgi:phosphatidylglycerol---prolipoprotein diacylglyceryl transferase